MTRAEAHEKAAHAQLEVNAAESALDCAEHRLSEARRELARFDGTPSPIGEQNLQKVRDWLDRQALLGMSREHQAVVERLIEDLR